MHRIAGWLAKPSQHSETALARMWARCSAAFPDQGVGDPTGAVAASHSVAREGMLIAAVCGRPRLGDRFLTSASAAGEVLALWRQHGVDAPKHIHGNFSLAILDLAAERVFLALDRIGAEKLAYAVLPNGVAFASQADMVAAHPELDERLDPQGLFNFIYFYQAPAPGSIFEKVGKLLPGQWLEWQRGEVRQGFYWALHYRDTPRNDFDEQSRVFHELLRDGVRRARGEDRVAAFLSGGTDSSTVSGVLRELAGQARTYSIGFDASGFDEIEYARIAARHFGLDSREYYLQREDVLAAIPVIAEHYDEPFANESAIPTYFCAKRAAEEGYTVMLAGDGGDEIFGGNERYATQKIFEAYHLLPAMLRQGVLEPLLRMPGLDAVSLLRRAQSYVRRANTPLPDRMESYNHVYLQPLEQMFTADFLAQVEATQPTSLLREVYFRADSQSFINRMLHLDLKFTLADNDLRKVGAMTEAAGVEVRYPLLDDAMVEFSGQVPPDWKVKGRYLRWFFKKALTGYLPDEIINKSKHGFGLPFGIWAKEYAPLRERIQDRVSAFAGRGILAPGFIEGIRRQHETGHATYYGRMLWLMMILEEWLAFRKL
ncbi:MAG: asparagine synthetase B family protein [Pseudomonadota bacterium]